MGACRLSWHRQFASRAGLVGGSLRSASPLWSALRKSFAVWRPSSLTRYINGRTASRKESFPTPNGGLKIISGNDGWRNCHGA
jgi:hypothetical protein